MIYDSALPPQALSQLVKLMSVEFPAVTLQKRQTFWTGPHVLKYLENNGYLQKIDSSFKDIVLNESKDDVQNSFQLAMQALGGLVMELEKACIVEDVLSMGLFDVFSFGDGLKRSQRLPDSMLVDSITSKNLNLLPSPTDPTDSLLSFLNR